MFKILLSLVQRLPLSLQVRLRSLLVPVSRLDYCRDVILLYAESQRDLKRARACSKEPETIRWIEGYVQPGEVFYDIGANVGAYSFVAAKHCAGKVAVYAFEPSFATYSQLCRNILLNRCQDYIFPYMLALSKDSGTSVFNYRSMESGASLHTIDENSTTIGHSLDPVYCQRILTFSIDDLVGRYGFAIPNHIKLDVDGSETDILFGASETLNDRRVRSMLVEVCDWCDGSAALVEYLAHKGFRLACQTQRGKNIANCIFKRYA